MRTVLGEAAVAALQRADSVNVGGVEWCDCCVVGGGRC
jgi:hypothetical protein